MKVAHLHNLKIHAERHPILCHCSQSKNNRAGGANVDHCPINKEIMMSKQNEPPTHGVSGAPIVDWVVVDGRPIPITCRRDYDAAKRDYYKRVAKNVVFPDDQQASS